ncbi:MAG TPA: SCO family protein [Bryobacteraceae bacterium]|nr:SCO family protein [Bryobacteraceae bacterium]HPU71871.1 SCO family protein [Bryobacteraceae bacterium]
MKYSGLILACALLAGCASRKPLPVLGQVPEFTLTAQDGEPFDSKSLEGKIWVSDFIFTTCPGPCPRMSSQMRWVGQQVADLPDVRLVSFTVDPEHDTPPVLAEYAKRFGADPGQWHFLTGPSSVLQHIDREGFKLGGVDGSLTHSTRFVLVDRQRRIRGYYHTDDDEGLKQLVSDIRRLAREGT